MNARLFLDDLPSYLANRRVRLFQTFETTVTVRTRIQDGNVWIAEVDGEAAGILVLEEEQDFLTIYSIAVAPEFQGRGLAKALLAHAEDYADKKMLPKLRLYTNKRMQRNVALYVSYGFANNGERGHPSREGEVLIHMVKPAKKAP